MSVDSTFEFEKRRNRPVKYDRDLVTKTLGAMERVEEIKGKREERFYENRMKDRKTLVKKQKVAEKAKKELTAAKKAGKGPKVKKDPKVAALKKSFYKSMIAD